MTLSAHIAHVSIAARIAVWAIEQYGQLDNIHLSG